MIVADADLLAYLVVRSARSEAADAVLARDSRWIAPNNQREEILNVISKNVRGQKITLDVALVAFQEAVATVEYEQEKPDEAELLSLSVRLNTTTYDSAYVWLARQQAIRLVTGDARLIQCAPDVAVSIEDFAAGK